MSLRWLFDWARRSHPLVPGTAIAMLGALVCTAALLGTEGGFVRAELDPRQIVGTLCLFVLLPAYMVTLVPLMRGVTVARLEELRGLGQDEAIDRIQRGMDRAPGWVWPAMAVGLAFGLSQNPVFVERILETGILHPLDVAFLFGALFLWIVVAIVLAWRLPTSRALSRLGGAVPLDVYRLDRLQPLARIATADVLVIVGAMAFSPLQGLDAEFRLGNYLPTILVGLPSAACLFLIPLGGARENILAVKHARLAELERKLAAIDRDDVASLEPVVAHLERVRAISSWPVDLEIVSRVLVYGVIPPLAWVAAALVENAIDRLTS